MRAVDLLLHRLRTRVAECRDALEKQHALHRAQIERGTGEECEPGIRRAGDELRQALAELRGADAAATAARQGLVSVPKDTPVAKGA